jgi:hypothetical protein
MLRAACAGFAGVNLHGGGMGIYTPIESAEADAPKPRPVYYGMQLAQHFVGCQVAPCRLQTPANVTAYQGLKQGRTLLAVVNKGADALDISVPAVLHGAKLWELTGPALDARTDVSFRQVHSAGASLSLRAYSAVLLEAS